MTEAHQDYTPYHYCFNNPINLIDPFGLDTITAQQGDKQPVKKDDVVKMPDGSEATMNADAVTIEGKKKEKEGAEKKDLPEITVKEDDKNPAGDILKSGMVMALVATQVDSPLLGPGDVVGAAIAGATLLTAAIAWTGYEIYQFAAEHKKNARNSSWDRHSGTRSGETTGKTRNANRGNKNQKNEKKPNPNKKSKE